MSLNNNIIRGSFKVFGKKNSILSAKNNMATPNLKNVFHPDNNRGKLQTSEVKTRRRLAPSAIEEEEKQTINVDGVSTHLAKFSAQAPNDRASSVNRKQVLQSIEGPFENQF